MRTWAEVEAAQLRRVQDPSRPPGPRAAAAPKTPLVVAARVLKLQVSLGFGSMESGYPLLQTGRVSLSRLGALPSSSP